MSVIDPAVRLGDLVAQYPNSTRVLMLNGLDFCCGGKLTLAQACENKSLPVDGILAAISGAITANPATQRWDEAPVGALITHILEAYHAPLPEDLRQLGAMSQKLLRVHGDQDPRRLTKLAGTIALLTDELLLHMRREEENLFPWILSGRQPKPTAVIRSLELEHDGASELLETIKELTDEFQPPSGACATWRNLYARLESFDAALRRHIHLENNILHPRVLG